ncbi:hypothetical protein HK102_002206, partial [Quaeritorhiza haematococci]
GKTPYATVSSRISGHFKRSNEQSRKPILGKTPNIDPKRKAIPIQPRKWRYYLDSPDVPIGEVTEMEGLQLPPASVLAASARKANAGSSSTRGGKGDKKSRGSKSSTGKKGQKRKRDESPESLDSDQEEEEGGGSSSTGFSSPPNRSSSSSNGSSRSRSRNTNKTSSTKKRRRNETSPSPTPSESESDYSDVAAGRKKGRRTSTSKSSRSRRGSMTPNDRVMPVGAEASPPLTVPRKSDRSKKSRG